MVIAIDGPAGAGKSTVAPAGAGGPGFTDLESGGLSRAVALRGADPATVAREARLELGERVTLDGEDVTERIREPWVSEAASRVSSDPEVREALVEQQRRILAEGDWVAEGRDIGTVVAPDAAVKVFLTADPAERARRRAAELGADPEVVLRDQTLRDEQDRNRAYSPLQPAPGAVEVDTTGLSLDQVVEKVAALVREVR